MQTYRAVQVFIDFFHIIIYIYVCVYIHIYNTHTRLRAREPYRYLILQIIQ